MKESESQSCTTGPKAFNYNKKMLVVFCNNLLPENPHETLTLTWWITHPHHVIIHKKKKKSENTYLEREEQKIKYHSFKNRFPDTGPRIFFNLEPNLISNFCERKKERDSWKVTTRSKIWWIKPAYQWINTNFCILFPSFKMPGMNFLTKKLFTDHSCSLEFKKNTELCSCIS